MMKQLNTNIPQVKLIKTEAKLSYASPKVTELFCADVIEGGGPNALESQGGGLLS